MPNSKGDEKKSPTLKVRGAHKSVPATTYSPTGSPGSTIAAEGLNFRVRDGNRWVPLAIVTGKLYTLVGRVRAS